ncbi:MAG: HisA/HisF-related TIM barrel protein, partial [Sarcina sp.]
MKKIIPCLDMKDGNVVKGVNFVNIKNVGDPVEIAKKYCEDGADELVFLDIAATIEERKTRCDLVKKVASVVNIPFTVGGGIKSISDIEEVL